MEEREDAHVHRYLGSGAQGPPPLPDTSSTTTGVHAVSSCARQLTVTGRPCGEAESIARRPGTRRCGRIDVVGGTQIEGRVHAGD